MRYKEFYSTKKQDVAEDKLNEVDFASELGELSVPHEEMIDDSSVDGTIGTRKVQLYKSGKNKIYFFTDNKKIDALVYLYGDRVMGMKNFSANKGLIYNLFQYIVNIKKQKVRLTPEDKLTSDGIKWITDQISRPNGFKITDTDGNKINPKSLYDEWENARTSGTNGPTEIVIGESRNGKQIRENEIKLIPMDIFGATLKKIDEQLLSRVGMNNILEQGVAEGEKEALQFATQAHSGQTRAGGDPYISHPMRVADHIRQYKKSHNLDALISAAYLHDTIEDTETTHEALQDLFGGLVASLVKELTSDPEKIKQMGKAKYLAHKMATMSSYALVIKLADRLDNVKDITTAKTPEWRQKYKNETEQILDYIEKTRVLSGTHQKLIQLIRDKLSELDDPDQGVAEGNTDEILSEKAKSKAQQRFFGMAHALQKGEKIPGASKELTKVAKTMGKKDVKDFAKTKRKGLPAHVKKD